MEAEDLIDLPASSNSGCKSENDNLHNSNRGPSDAFSQPSNSGIKEDKLNGGISGTSEVDVGIGDSLPFLENDTEGDVTGSSSIMQEGVELNGTVIVGEGAMFLSSGIQIANGCVTGQHGSPIRNRKRDGSPNSNHKIDDSSISGVKKARVTVDEQQPSVHVMFNSLTRESKRKLEKLLQQWSEWHAQHSSSSHDSNQVLETGEETYFPALRVGLDNNSSVSFWMDNQKRNQNGMEEFNVLDSKSVPLYDRGYTLDGGLDIVDASRCFNCSSYSHSMKECPKPRDNAAVNSARKQHKSRRNQNPSSRNPTRYYQNSPAGKYDGLRPGVLDAETRQLLGLGELDPPPWLNRMREMGYPLGYLDPEDDDEPSGITIFADEESKEGKEDGEILEADHPEPPRKMSVEFPGLNAPIPENADKRRWAAGHSSSDSSRNRSHRRSDHLSEPMSRSQPREQRWSREYIDEGPSGCDPGFSPTLSSHSRKRSPTFGRTFSDRDRWNPSVYEDSLYPGSHGSAPYSPLNMRFSPPRNYGSASFETRDDDRWSDFNRSGSSHHRRSRW